MSSDPRPPAAEIPDEAPPSDGHVATLQAVFDERGPAAIATLREYDAGAYLQAIAKLVEGLD